jgi:hypothetical protein
MLRCTKLAWGLYHPRREAVYGRRGAFDDVGRMRAFASPETEPAALAVDGTFVARIRGYFGSAK